jgi:hypothetical protein
MIHWLWEPVGLRCKTPSRRLFLSNFLGIGDLIQIAACNLNCVASPRGLPRRSQNTQLRSIIPALEYPRRLLLAVFPYFYRRRDFRSPFGTCYHRRVTDLNLSIKTGLRFPPLRWAADRAFAPWLQVSQVSLISCRSLRSIDNKVSSMF